MKCISKMNMFKKKAVVTVGRGDWAVEVPRPPKFATHARLTLRDYWKDNGKPKVSTLPIQDFGCFKGVAGEFYYLRMNNSRKVLEEYEGTWHWDGHQVENIEKLRGKELS